MSEQASLPTEIDRIRDGILDAIEVIRDAGKLTDAEIGMLIHNAKTHVRRLRKVTAASHKGMRKQLQVANGMIWGSVEAYICAVVRASMKLAPTLSYAEIVKRANELTVWQTLSEPVFVYWREKSGKPGEYRPIVAPGPMRRAQAFAVRDVLSVIGIDNDFDFTRKGAKGEKGLVETVCRDIVDGINWWWTPDVRNCFPSIRPGHFGWLPIDRRIKKNVFYLPKCAEIVVKNPGAEIGKVFKSIEGLYPDLSVGNVSQKELSSLTVQIVRRGLPQGSVLSPLLARAVVRRAMGQAQLPPGVHHYSFADNLHVGASTKQEIGAAVGAVTEAFSSLPGGQIELHPAKARHARSWRVDILGYKLEPGNGYGANAVHVKPGPERTARYRRKLMAKLVRTNDTSERFKIGETYCKRWFGTQSGWTKVPRFSRKVALAITDAYVDDFNRNILTADGKLDKAKLLLKPK